MLKWGRAGREARHLAGSAPESTTLCHVTSDTRITQSYPHRVREGGRVWLGAFALSRPPSFETQELLAVLAHVEAVVTAASQSS